MQKSESIVVSASIENNSVSIYGHTSPNVRVELSSSKVFAITFSDNTGYFKFDKTLLPKNPSDLCLSSIDDNSRPSLPVCIPAPPATNYHTDIGPIILPPTLTLDTDIMSASGQSIPNSTINIYLYQVKDNAPTIVKPAQAFRLPIFETSTDTNGNYSFNIPTAYSSDYRLYSTVKFDDQQSPKSNSLLYLLPQQFNFSLIILFTTCFVFLLLFFYFIPRKKHYYPAIFSYPLAIREQ